MDTKKLEDLGACREGLSWGLTQNVKNDIELIEEAAKQNHRDWAMWFLKNLLTEEQKKLLIIFSSEQVKRRDVSADDAYEMSKHSKTSEEWADVAVGFANKYVRGDRDSDYFEDSVSAVFNSICADKIRRKFIGEIFYKILNYGLSLLRK